MGINLLVTLVVEGVYIALKSPSSIAYLIYLEGGKYELMWMLLALQGSDYKFIPCWCLYSTFLRPSLPSLLLVIPFTKQQHPRGASGVVVDEMGDYG